MSAPRFPLELSSSIAGLPVAGKCCGWSKHGVFALASSQTVGLSIQSPRECEETIRIASRHKLSEIRWQNGVISDYYPVASFLAVRTAHLLFFYRVARAGDRCMCATNTIQVVGVQNNESNGDYGSIRCFCWIQSAVLISAAGALYSYCPSASEGSNTSAASILTKPLVTLQQNDFTAIQVCEDERTVVCGCANGLIYIFHFNGASLLLVRNVDLVHSCINELCVSLRPNRRTIDLCVATAFSVMVLTSADDLSKTCAVHASCQGVTSFVRFPHSGGECLSFAVLTVSPYGVHGIFGSSCMAIITCPAVVGSFNSSICNVCDLVIHCSLSVFALVCQCSKGRVRLFMVAVEDSLVSPLFQFVTAYKAAEQIVETMPLWILRNTENALDYFATEVVFPAFPSPLLSHYHKQRLAPWLPERVLAWNAIREEYFRQRRHLGVNFFLEPAVNGVQRWKLLLIQLLRLDRIRQLISELLLGHAISLYQSWKRGSSVRQEFRSDGALQYIRLYQSSTPAETWIESALSDQLSLLLTAEKTPPAAAGYKCSVCQVAHNVEMSLTLVSVSAAEDGECHTSYFDPNLFNTVSLYEEQELLSMCKQCGLYSFVTRGTCDLCWGLLL